MATVMAMMGGVRLVAQENSGGAAPFSGPTVKVGLIGLGAWGRDILATLGRLPQADLAVICDNYPAFLRRSGRRAPDAAQAPDYQTLLDDSSIQAIIIATPTHQHREIAIAALKAGKHVYCEAPLAHTLEDAQAIALAAKSVPGQVFQTGLQLRADPQRHFLLPFIRSGAIGRWVSARMQFNKKTSWRLASPNPDREVEINWRLDEQLSLGLPGEVGMHLMDQVAWFMDRRPVAISGRGAIRLWDDGRTVADTVHVHLEFPDAVNAYFDATLANSFEGEMEAYYGSDAAILMRESSAWMFKEVDSPLLGWEVYAQKEQFHRETGIVLKVGGSKQSAMGEDDGPAEPEKLPLHHSLESFLKNCASVNTARADFVEVFGADDAQAISDHLAEVKRVPTAGYMEGFHAALLGIKAAEATRTGQRIVFEEDWFELT